MTKKPRPTSEELKTLSGQLALLEARNAALAQLCATSSEIRRALQSEPSADIDAALERRDKECKQYASLCEGSMPSNEAILDSLRYTASTQDAEIAKQVRSALSLYARSQMLAEEILTCQSECEIILKSRLKATAQALRESTQRRKLDAAYGPACKHSSPAFLDRQR